MDALYRAALGPVQLPRYLALFGRFDQAGRAPIGWNLAASLATLNWMVLHHLWTAALMYVALVEGLALLIFGVGRPMLHWPAQVEWGLFAAFAMFAIALPGLFGDALLHGEIRKRIARALVAAHSIPETCELLARQASSWRRLAWIAAANVLLFAAIAVTWALVPPSDPDAP
ncbi:MAG: SPOR domain-containing protein, partial [Giesbergeria sp.]